MTLPRAYKLSSENDPNILSSISQNIGPSFDSDLQKFAELSLSETKKDVLENQTELNERVLYIKNVRVGIEK